MLAAGTGLDVASLNPIEVEMLKQAALASLASEAAQVKIASGDISDKLLRESVRLSNNCARWLDRIRKLAKGRKPVAAPNSLLSYFQKPPQKEEPKPKPPVELPKGLPTWKVPLAPGEEPATYERERWGSAP